MNITISKEKIEQKLESAVGDIERASLAEDEQRFKSAVRIYDISKIIDYGVLLSNELYAINLTEFENRVNTAKCKYNIKGAN